MIVLVLLSCLFCEAYLSDKEIRGNDTSEKVYLHLCDGAALSRPLAKKMQALLVKISGLNPKPKPQTVIAPTCPNQNFKTA